MSHLLLVVQAALQLQNPLEPPGCRAESAALHCQRLIVPYWPWEAEQCCSCFIRTCGRPLRIRAMSLWTRRHWLCLHQKASRGRQPDAARAIVYFTKGCAAAGCQAGPSSYALSSELANSVSCCTSYQDEAESRGGLGAICLHI
jgi:hypothetical protein